LRHRTRRDAATDQSITSEPMTPPVAMVPSIKLSLEAGGHWGRPRLQDWLFTGPGVVGGRSGGLDVPTAGPPRTRRRGSAWGAGVGGGGRCGRIYSGMT